MDESPNPSVKTGIHDILGSLDVGAEHGVVLSAVNIDFGDEVVNEIDAFKRGGEAVGI